MNPCRTIPSLVRGQAIHRDLHEQCGQALLEACIMLSLFLLLGFALSWLAGLQDIGLAAQHAGRQLAFMHARGSQDDMHMSIRRHFLSGPAHRWSSINGDVLFDAVFPASQAHIDSSTALSDHAQPAGAAPHAAELREGWALNDKGIATAQVSVTTRSSGRAQAAVGASPASHVMGASWTLRRHTSVLTDAGHAEDDGAVQKRVAGSRAAWTDSAHASSSLARRMSNRMGAVDSAWKRPLPDQDWLDVWEGAVPERHVVSHDGGLYGQ
jgi:hypothetical protein